jgi:DNA-directed RNA polymerase specialized sigma24 family protein
MSEQEQILSEISTKMDQIIRLLALNLVKDMETQKEQILTLASFDFGPSEIAELIGTTSNTVNVTLSRAKKVH